ncbi:MAG: O-methyltransferase [Bacteroidales bacterium]
MKASTYLTDPKLEAYSEKMSNPMDKILYDLYRETNLKVLRPRMLTGHIQGKLLEFVSKLFLPKKILEIGTYTGYATICLARGLAYGGVIHTIERNPEVLEYARKYFDKEGISQQVFIHNEDALKVLHKIDPGFDLVFIDGEKSEYPDYLNAVKPLLNPNSILIVDNVLWDGKVANMGNPDKETEAVHRTNKMIQEDTEFNNFLLPVRDGLMVARYEKTQPQP